jgi:Spy/CpxP family protein refolding chaperone
MKTLLTLTSGLALSALLLTAYAQAPATSHDNPTPAKPTIKGATSAGGSKNLGQKMIRKSKPTDSPVTVRPVKQP